MTSRMAALLCCMGIVLGLCGMARADGIMDKIINDRSVAAWNAWGADAKLREDATVTGNHALRVTVAHKPAHSWDAAASLPTNKPVKKGDIILVAVWARAEVPAPDKDYGRISAIAMQINGSPYTMLFSDSADIGTEWAMYYASGVAENDYDAGKIQLTVQLGAEKQTIDLGPAFIIDFGPDYDMKKLPHNPHHADAAPAAGTAAPAIPFARELADLRTKLPVPGTLMSPPRYEVYTYGGNISGSELRSDASAPGGHYIHVPVPQATEHSWDQGATVPLFGEIHKGDVLLLTVWLRNPAESGTADIPVFGINDVKPPYTAVVQGKANVPARSWHPYYASGTAKEDIAAGKAVITMQLGNVTPGIDIGPVMALNLGPDADPAKLPQ